MAAVDEFRRALIALDVDTVIRIWRAVHPSLPVPPTRRETLAAMHMARTGAGSLPLGTRAYSHAWLLASGYPSSLPDHLKPAAERLYPRSEEAVGISINSKYPVVKEAVYEAMRDAVLEAYADGHAKDYDLIKKRMQAARQRELKGLGLI